MSINIPNYSSVQNRSNMSGGVIAGAILIPNIGGWIGLAAGIIKNRIGLNWYETLIRPSWYPPDWLVGILWTIWFSSMGYSSYLVYKDIGGFTERAVLPMTVYGLHLLICWTWTPVFLRTQSVHAGLYHILALDAMAVATGAIFFQTNRTALYAMIPFLCWMVFDTTLMFRVWSDNKNVGIIKDN